MKSLNKKGILIVVLLVFIVIVSFNIKKNSEDAFRVEQFVSEMKAKNCKFQLKDVEEDFLPTKRRRMIIGREAVDIYLYDSNKEAENDAKRVDSGGCGYNNGIKSINVTWSSYPHFYRKGNIIVQYVGKDNKIIKDLQDILGEQFAGYKSEY